MIGQKHLLDKLIQITEAGDMPRFSIIVGDSGSESKEIAPFIAEQLGANLIELPDVKVDTIREMSMNAYEQIEETVYSIVDADSMSLQAKNALLKMTEEPPNKAYFVMTLESTDNTLHTILSRAVVFNMDRYMPDEIAEYAGSMDDKSLKIIKGVCSTPGDVDMLASYDIPKLYSDVEKFIDDVSKVDGAKALTLSKDLSVKDGDGKIDMRLFLQMFQYICLHRAYAEEKTELGVLWCRGVIIAGMKLKDLRIKGKNRQMLIDSFILELRKIWK